VTKAVSPSSRVNTPDQTLSWTARAYLFFIIIAGLLATLNSVVTIIKTPPDSNWYWLTFLTLFSGFATVRFHKVGARFSVSETFVFSGTVLFGQAVGTLLVFLDALVLSGKAAIERGRVDWTRTPFNLAAPPLSAWLASSVLFYLAGPNPTLTGSGPEPSLAGDPWIFVAALAAFTILFFLLNSGLVALAIALSQRHGALAILRDLGTTWWNIKHLFLNYLAGASIAALLASGANPTIGVRLTVILPLMAVLYWTYRQAAKQVELMQSRIDDIERVHMSTIQAFAMAIDAKDQVTHGHIRRVQQYTMETARALGVDDDKQLRAIEAAALLHDTGKLAVPEYILNKPGPLTPAEFEKMKEHAAVGANILKSIDFPYPVEPIVRHHHENWDGRGYPDGLQGQEIPLGARILSVVDCYDALTSDRPYRPRMTRQQAEQILLDRRGTMYDPWVVDGFRGILDKLEAIDAAEGHSVKSPGSTAATLDVISAATAEEREFGELRRELPKASTLVAAVEILFGHLRRVVPAAAVAMYVQPPGEDDLKSLYCAGSGASTIESTRIPVGERISGWAFAHRQIVFNSEATLDLGPVARSLPVPLRYALAVPVSDGHQTIGVIALYAGEEFQRDHSRMVESAAQLFFQAGQHSMQASRSLDRGEGKRSDRQVH
jgi:putative nucleotidyltransferase with HDIG domain